MKSISSFEKKKLNAKKMFKGGAEATQGPWGPDRKRKNGTIITNTGDWCPFNNDKL